MGSPAFIMIDLSHTLNEKNMSIYPGDPIFSCTPHASVAHDGYSVGKLSLGTHTGTHIDAPSHFIAGGVTVDMLPQELLVGEPLVIDLREKGSKERIQWADLASYQDRMKPGTLLILWTGWDVYWGTRQYMSHPFLERSAAENVLARGIKVIALDTLNPDETGGEDFGVHEVVLGGGGVIIENLTNIEQLQSALQEHVRKTATVFFMPMKVGGGDGAPIRAFAMI